MFSTAQTWLSLKFCIRILRDQQNFSCILCLLDIYCLSSSPHLSEFTKFSNTPSLNKYPLRTSISLDSFFFFSTSFHFELIQSRLVSCEGVSPESQKNHSLTVNQFMNSKALDDVSLLRPVRIDRRACTGVLSAL